MRKTEVGFLVRKADDGTISAEIETITPDQLPPGEVTIRVAYSSLNYKDALACHGHPGVVGQFPHVPGIDCAGTVEVSSDARFAQGQKVLVTGYGLGSERWGGYATLVRVPADWVVPLPEGLSLYEAMIYGTAGFTAAQSVAAIVEHGISPGDGKIIVTGATGGVGSFAVGFLAKLGYHVVASTGKPEAAPFLKSLGAAEIVDRQTLQEPSKRPLLTAKWAGAVDTVGGNTLETILRSTKHRACVTACGLVGGTDLNLTVYPFILRGVIFIGIDSAKCPMPRRLEMWKHLAGDWRLSSLDSLATTITLDELPDRVERIMQGKITGRTVVTPESETN